MRHDPSKGLPTREYIADQLTKNVFNPVNRIKRLTRKELAQDIPVTPDYYIKTLEVIKQSLEELTFLRGEIITSLKVKRRYSRWRDVTDASDISSGSIDNIMKATMSRVRNEQRKALTEGKAPYDPAITTVPADATPTTTPNRRRKKPTGVQTRKL